MKMFIKLWLFVLALPIMFALFPIVSFYFVLIKTTLLDDLDIGLGLCAVIGAELLYLFMWWMLLVPLRGGA